MTLSDLAASLDAHIKRGIGVGARTTYDPATLAADRVAIKYAFGCAESHVDKASAEVYLAWLDAGNVGRHWEIYTT